MLAEQCQVCVHHLAAQANCTVRLTCACLLAARAPVALQCFLPMAACWSVDAHGGSATFTDSVSDSVGTRDCVPSLVQYAQLLCVHQW